MGPRPPETKAPKASTIAIFTTYGPFTLFLFIFGIRLLDALTIATFFQPDEYYQSLEVAAATRFENAYVTWEWNHAIRSIFYPKIFETVFDIVDEISQRWRPTPLQHSEMLIVGPKIVGALTAAVGDLYTGLLARRIWGEEAGGYAVLFSLFSAWNWFCWPRTFSNCLETTLTVIGMTYWPWKEFKWRHLTLASLFAAAAFTIRPTNGLVTWAIGPLIFERLPSFTQRFGAAIWIGAVSAGVLYANALLDATYYQRLTLPFLEFYRLNVTEKISEFYGTSPWHYYYTQGLPLLLTGYLPLALFSLYKGLLAPRPLSYPKGHYAPSYHLSRLINTVPLLYLPFKHKEVRFLFPILPILHVLMAGTGLPSLPPNLSSPSTKQKIILGMIAINIPIALYTSLIHQRGVISVVDWLRKDHYTHYLPAAVDRHKIEDEHMETPLTTEQLWMGARVGFLMPCHSTPFVSHLWMATIGDMTVEAAGLRARADLERNRPAAWFLTCEPPIERDAEEREFYRDEADLFFDFPLEWIKSYFYPPLKRGQWAEVDVKGDSWRGYKRLWPERMVVFDSLLTRDNGVREYIGLEKEKVDGKWVKGWGAYEECARFFNSHWHDDGRRKGDVVVLCLERGKE